MITSCPFCLQELKQDTFGKICSCIITKNNKEIFIITRIRGDGFVSIIAYESGKNLWATWEISPIKSEIKTGYFSIFSDFTKPIFSKTEKHSNLDILLYIQSIDIVGVLNRCNKLANLQ